MEEVKSQGAEAKGQIRVDATGAENSYSNFFLVSAGSEECVLTFGVHTGEDAPVRVKDRIFVTPRNAKRLVMALAQALKAYEDKFGTIDVSAQGQEVPRKK